MDTFLGILLSFMMVYPIHVALWLGADKLVRGAGPVLAIPAGWVLALVIADLIFTVLEDNTIMVE